MQRPAQRLILDAGTGRHAGRVGGQKGKGTLLAATIFGQVKADPPDLVPQRGAAASEKPRQPLAAGGNRFMDPGVQFLPSVEERRLAEILGAQDAAGGAFDAPHRLAKLAVLIEQALSGRIRLPVEILKVSKMLLAGARARSTCRRAW